MSLDWGKIESEAGGAFAPMAEEGFYKVALDSVDMRETKNSKGETTYWLDLFFKETEENAFPKISHPISFKNDSWRQYHFMLMLKELGIPEEKAKAAIENCESKKGQPNIAATYRDTFARATEKNPEVEIEVYPSENINPNSGRPYMRADFKNQRISFGRESAKATPSAGDSVLESGSEINLTDIPF